MRKPVWLGLLLAGPCLALDAATYFLDATATHVPKDANLHSLDAEFGDFDKDGDLDVAVAVEGGVNRLYLNDGKGRLTWKQGAFSSVSRDSEDLQIADFNKDGNLDVVFITEDDAVHALYHGDGKGNFQDVSAKLSAWRCPSNGVAAADLNKDGYPDILLGCEGQDLALVNDKQGGFVNETSTRLPALTESTQDVELGDLDGDGDLDLVLANENQKNRLLLNDGAGRFAAADANLPIPYPEETREVLLFDADGDKDLDIVFCNLTCNACNQRVKNPQVRLLLNDGKAKFTDATAARLPVNAFSSWDGGFVDYDADGDLDLIICAIDVPGFTGLQLRAWENDGKGFFTDATAKAIPASAKGRTWDVEVADLDKDGTLDMFIGCWGTQALLLLGTEQAPAAIRKGEAPRPAQGRLAAAPAPWTRLFGWARAFLRADGRRQ